MLIPASSQTHARRLSDVTDAWLVSVAALWPSYGFCPNVSLQTGATPGAADGSSRGCAWAAGAGRCAATSPNHPSSGRLGKDAAHAYCSRRFEAWLGCLSPVPSPAQHTSILLAARHLRVKGEVGRGVLTARQGPAAGGPLCVGPSDLPPLVCGNRTEECGGESGVAAGSWLALACGLQTC